MSSPSARAPLATPGLVSQWVDAPAWIAAIIPPLADLSGGALAAWAAALLVGAALTSAWQSDSDGDGPDFSLHWLALGAFASAWSAPLFATSAAGLFAARWRRCLLAAATGVALAIGPLPAVAQEAGALLIAGGFLLAIAAPAGAKP